MSIKIHLFFLIFLGVIAQKIAAKNSEVYFIEEIKQHVKDGTFLIYDIDNTLIEPKQVLGSDQWFEFIFKSKLREYDSFNEALADSIVWYNRIHEISEVRTCEKETQNILENIHQTGIQSIAMTARNSKLKSATQRQLHSVNIKFNPLDLQSQVYTFQKNKDSYFEDGIIYTNGNSKGDVLKEFFEHFQIDARHIVFIDDKMKNVESVQHAVEAMDRHYTGLRYAHLDKKVLEFEHEIAQIQAEYLNKILSDSDAYAVLMHRKMNT